MVWQTYDYWHDINGGFMGAKIGNQPQNVIYDANAKRFLAVNATAKKLDAQAVVAFFDTTGRKLAERRERVILAPDSRCDLFELPELAPENGILLIRATLGTDENFTWINVKKDRDYRALLPLLSGTVELKDAKVDRQGKTAKGLVTVMNTSAIPQLLVRVRLTDAKGARVLPVHWSANYLNLMPGERKTITFEATDVSAAVGELKPVLTLSV